MSVEPLDPMEAAIYDAVIELEAIEAIRARRYRMVETCARWLWRGAIVAATLYVVAGSL